MTYVVCDSSLPILSVETRNYHVVSLWRDRFEPLSSNESIRRANSRMIYVRKMCVHYKSIETIRRIDKYLVKAGYM